MSGVLILDFGSQFTQLIARRIRELGVYCEIHPGDRGAGWVREYDPAALILSGGPASAHQDGAPRLADGILDHGLPVLGICYGMQLLALHAGGHLEASTSREYGRAELTITDGSATGMFEGFEGASSVVWMSHGDSVKSAPGYTTVGVTGDAVAAIAAPDRRLWGVQFHPEVAHTERGTEMLRNFLFNVAGCEKNWTPANVVQERVAAIRNQIGSADVVCGLSGGVDSAVAAALVARAVGKQLKCMFVDTGLLRLGERESVEQMMGRHLDVELVTIDAAELFLKRLAGVTDPELKRKIIGHTFIDVFEAAAVAHGDARFLVQGTLYPDVIESASSSGPAVTIKSHHNVGGLRPDHDFELVEPLRDLFKDESRAVGRELGLAEGIIGRHPFPGPGLAIRIMGEVTEKGLACLRGVDDIYINEIRAAGLYDEIWQAFAVLLPVKTVGVMGDARTYENVVALRAVTSMDGMTADWYEIPGPVLRRISSRIINEVPGVNRVTYDISSKPPATIEWE